MYLPKDRETVLMLTSRPPAAKRRKQRMSVQGSDAETGHGCRWRPAVRTSLVRNRTLVDANCLERADPQIVAGGADRYRLDVATIGEPYGRLSSSWEARHPIDLRAGTRYRVVGVCDRNCSALALGLFDENGRGVDVGAGSQSGRRSKSRPSATRHSRCRSRWSDAGRRVAPTELACSPMRADENQLSDPIDVDLA